MEAKLGSPPPIMSHFRRRSTSDSVGWYSEAVSFKASTAVTARLQTYCSLVNLPLTKEVVQEILQWPVEKFLAVLLKGKAKHHLCNLDYFELCTEMSKTFVVSSKEEFYFYVTELVSDINLPEFKHDMYSYGLVKKQFLNEVFGVLKDLSNFSLASPKSLSPLSRRKTVVLTEKISPSSMNRLRSRVTSY